MKNTAAARAAGFYNTDTLNHTLEGAGGELTLAGGHVIATLQGGPKVLPLQAFQLVLLEEDRPQHLRQ